MQSKLVHHPGKNHVEDVLWKIDGDQRLRIWEALGRYDALEVLELGNSDTLDIDEELRVLARQVLPPRLDGVRVLFLGWMSNLTDATFQALAAAGCGTNLTSLSLEGECFGFSRSPPPPCLF